MAVQFAIALTIMVVMAGTGIYIVELRYRLRSQQLWLRMLDRRFDDVSDQVAKLRRDGTPEPTEQELQEAEEALIRLLDHLLRVESSMKS